MEALTDPLEEALVVLRDSRKKYNDTKAAPPCREHGDTFY
jgi:hypothetical protein